jgi:hypothetical protein
MLGRVAILRSDVSEELSRATRRNIPEDVILHSHRRENLKSCIVIIHLRNFTIAIYLANFYESDFLY